MRRFVQLLLVAAVALGAASASALQPHIVFIFADDLGLGDVSCYGGKIQETPNIDRLAKEGIRFEQFYVAAPICSPSRCGLITGQYPARWRITSYLADRARNRGAGQADYLDPRAPSLPRILQQAGYRTAHIGKWHLGGGRDVDDAPDFAAYGYDEHASTYESPQPDPNITATDWIWSPKDKVKRWNRTEYFVDKTLDFLRRNQDAPCFVNLWLDDVHTPWVPDANTQKEEMNDRESLQPVLRELDRQVGRLADGLKELAIDDQTLLIFASDHGPYPHLKGRTVGFRGCKLSLYEGGIRVPFIARWPGRIPAGVSDATTIITALDVLPTFCRIAAAELPEDVSFDGRDCSAALFGEPIAGRSNSMFWEYGRNEEFYGYPRRPRDRSPNLAVRDEDWKLLINSDGTGLQLYNLAADPHENKNLALERPQVAAELRKLVLDWRSKLPQAVPP